VTNVVSLVDTGISVWQAALERLRIDCKDYLGLEMLDTVSYDGFVDGIVQLSVPDELRENWIKSHYASMLHNAFVNVIGSAFVDFSIRIVPQVSSKTVFPRVAPVVRPVVERVKKRVSRPKLPLYAGYTFENFIEGDSNFTACEACKAVAEKPGDPDLNPLFVYGKSGLGKTHLLQSIAAYMVKTRPQTKVVYCHAYDFLSDATAVSKAISAKKGNVRELANAFMEKYERCDVLLFDDVQLLESKKTICQERLAVLVKHLRSMGKQVVFSSDRRPCDFRRTSSDSEVKADGGVIPHISARLLAPLESCVAVGIDAPDLNTRMKLIQKKSMNIPFLDKDRDEICRFLSLPPRENVRVIEGMLNGLRAMNELCSENLDLGAVKRLVAAPGTTGVVELSIKGISETVAMEFNADLTALTSKRQDAGVALPRKVSMYLARELTNSSLAEIGTFFNRDYSSVIAAVQSLAKQMDTDENLARKVKDIRYLLEA
jgi:chromosomal replication initiator protein